VHPVYPVPGVRTYVWRRWRIPIFRARSSTSHIPVPYVGATSIDPPPSAGPMRLWTLDSLCLLSACCLHISVSAWSLPSDLGRACRERAVGPAARRPRPPRAEVMTRWMNKSPVQYSHPINLTGFCGDRRRLSRGDLCHPVVVDIKIVSKANVPTLPTPSLLSCLDPAGVNFGMSTQ
jgi:hypothetical protein